MAGAALKRIGRIQNEGLKPDGKWNRRVIRHANGDLALHEVHYAPDGSIRSWSESASEAVDAGEGLAGLIEAVEFTYDTSCEACAKPILDVRDLPRGNPPN